MIHLLDIPDLPVDAFQPVAGRMRLHGGKSDAPPAPDYAAQANATAAGNLAAARSQTQANRIDQVTPYGSIRYTQGEGFDQAGYERALDAYKRQEQGLQANPQVREYMRATGALLTMPSRNDFLLNPDKWSSQIELSETGQQLLDADSRARLGLAGLQDDAIGRVKSALATPFDTSGIPGQIYGLDTDVGGKSIWDKYSGLLLDRMNPELDRQQAALDTKLANQGLTQGSEGWATGQSAFGKQRNDAATSAQLAGANLALQNAQLSNAGRNQELQTRATLRQMPLNELQALRSGAQVTNPTFNTPGQQGQTSGPDLMGASQASYNAQVGNVNAQNAQSAQTTGAAIGAVGAIAAAFF